MLCPALQTTVICLDDYHSLDRNGRKEKAVTALAPEAQNFELMYQQASVRAACAPGMCTSTCCMVCIAAWGRRRQRRKPGSSSMPPLDVCLKSGVAA